VIFRIGYSPGLAGRLFKNALFRLCEALVRAHLGVGFVVLPEGGAEIPVCILVV
jgi:hypothetical protein